MITLVIAFFNTASGANSVPVSGTKLISEPQIVFLCGFLEILYDK